MNSQLQNIVPVLGRFHPLLVHLPIGGLIVLAVLELLAKFSRFKNAAQSSSLILGFAAPACTAAAVCGWLLASSGHYDAQLLSWHKWTGTTVALGCTVTFLLRLRSCLRAYRFSLCATLAILVLASHFGGSMTHGRVFLTRHVPAVRHPFLQANASADAVSKADRPAEDRFFNGFVQPILREHCASCHGPEKQEADLRLDNLEALRKGGISGAAFVAGRARDSLLVQRLLLPQRDDEHMPPDGRPPLSAVETALLQWWIDNGILQAQQESGPQLETDARRVSGAWFQDAKPNHPVAAQP